MDWPGVFPVFFETGEQENKKTGEQGNRGTVLRNRHIVWNIIRSSTVKLCTCLK
jgi:hypothetical protein